MTRVGETKLRGASPPGRTAPLNLGSALRDEIASLPVPERCCAAWELRTIGRLMDMKDDWLEACPDGLARRLATLAPALDCTLELVRSASPAGSLRHDVRVRGAGGVEPGPLKSCCRGAILRGAVWRRTYLSSEGHLEFTCAEAVRVLLRRTRLRFLEGEKNGRKILYLKDQETIASAVGRMGAFGTMLGLEDVLVTKRLRNDINRAVNCEVGNLARTARSSQALLEAIRGLEAAGGLEALPARLREVAFLRARHPSASLRELAKRADPPLTKSGMQHRLEELARFSGQVRRHGG